MRLEKLLNYALALVFITLPFQTNFIIFSPVIYGGGKFNPYLTQTLSLTNLFILISLGLWGIYLWQNKKPIAIGSEKVMLGFLIFIILSQTALFFSQNPIYPFLTILKIILLSSIYFMIINQLISLEKISQIIIINAVIQSIISLMQVILQHSLGLKYLGEITFSNLTPGLAKFELGAQTIIRGYGTFAHPNILAGFLIMSLFLGLIYWKKQPYLSICSSIIILTGLVSTFSRTAILGLIIGGLGWLIISKKISRKTISISLASLGLIFSILWFLPEHPIKRFVNLPAGQEINQRLEYTKISLKMLEDYPLGYGYNQFTAIMQNYTQKKLPPWEIQPVHNSFLLISNENGILAGILLILICLVGLKTTYKNSQQFLNEDGRLLQSGLFGLILAITVILNFDHYFISLESGQIMFIIIISFLVFNLQKNKPIIKKITPGENLLTADIPARNH